MLLLLLLKLSLLMKLMRLLPLLTGLPRYSQVLEMELAQLHEAGASQAEVRAVAEEGIEAAIKKVERLEGVVREQKGLFEEADGEPNHGEQEGREGRKMLYIRRNHGATSHHGWGGRGGVINAP